MVKTLTEIMDSLKGRFGDDTSDEVITILEDVSDTIGDYESRLAGSEDWKAKYEETDRAWREKYTARFYSGTEELPLTNTDLSDNYDMGDETAEPIEFSDLFEEIKEDE